MPTNLDRPLINDSRMSRAALFSFGVILLVSLQAAFLQPYVILVHGERVNLFTTLLTGVALVVILGLHPFQRPRTSLFQSKWEPWVWAALGLTLTLSAWQSLERMPSIYRALSFYVPALAGYVCGRTMSDNDWWNRWVVPLFTTLFLAMSVGQIVNGFGPSFFNVHHHAMANMLLLLAAGPFTIFIRARSWKIKALAVGVLALGFVAAYLIGSRFIILLPFVLLPVFGAFRFMRRRFLLAAGVLFVIIASAFFDQMPDKVLKLHNYESVFYRIEGIPTALHIAKQNPLLGIGLRASREPYLKNYELHFDLTDMKTYMGVIRGNVTSDNMLTTMAVGAGMIPTTLYLIILAAFAGRIYRSLDRDPDAGLSHVAIGLCFTCCLIHFIIHDGLLYPQIGWYFHLLIGLIPFHSNRTTGGTNNARPA
jgi:hypothetical protein